MWAGVLGPPEVPLGYPQSWTFCSCGPVIAWAAYFLWKGPTLLLQQFQFAFSSLDLGWVSAQDQQESEEEEDLLRLGLILVLRGWRFIPILHKFP